MGAALAAIRPSRGLDEAWTGPLALGSTGCRQEPARRASGWAAVTKPPPARASEPDPSARVAMRLGPSHRACSQPDGQSPPVDCLARSRLDGRARPLDHTRPRPDGQPPPVGCLARPRLDGQARPVDCRTRPQPDGQLPPVDCRTRPQPDGQLPPVDCRTRHHPDDQVLAVDCHTRRPGDDQVLAVGPRGTWALAARTDSRGDPHGRASSRARRHGARRPPRSGAPHRRSRDALASNTHSPSTNRLPSNPNSPGSKRSRDQEPAVRTPSPAEVAGRVHRIARRCPRRQEAAARAAAGEASPHNPALPERTRPRRQGNSRRKPRRRESAPKLRRASYCPPHV
jgi:hypothetical protein